MQVFEFCKVLTLVTVVLYQKLYIYFFFLDRFHKLIEFSSFSLEFLPIALTILLFLLRISAALLFILLRRTLYILVPEADLIKTYNFIVFSLGFLEIYTICYYIKSSCH